MFNEPLQVTAVILLGYLTWYACDVNKVSRWDCEPVDYAAVNRAEGVE